MNSSFYLEAEAFFSTLPPEKEREYETKISKFAAKHDSPEAQETFRKMIADHAPCEYDAFFCLCTIYRRSKDYVLLRELLTNHRAFRKHVSYNHLYIMYLVHSESFYDYDDLLDMAFRDALFMDHNPGYLHTFANAFITICEKCTVEERTPLVEEWYDHALDTANRAIALEPGYAKFYTTKARIITLKNQFPEALELIRYATSIEDSSRTDYALTISNYQYYRLYISMCQQKYEFEQRFAALEQVLQSASPLSSQAAPPAAASTFEKPPRADRDAKEYVFVSYSHTDRQPVNSIIRGLQSQGLSVWYDEGIGYGKQWTEEIANHILGSQLVLVMLSNRAIHSPNVRREINLALSENKKLVPVLLEDVLLSADMRLQLSLHQMIQRSAFTPDEFITQLTATVRQTIAAE